MRMSGHKGSNLSSVAFPCAPCARSFASATALAGHRRDKHAGQNIASTSTSASNASTTLGKTSIPCTMLSCARIFSSQQALAQHLKSAIHARKPAIISENVGKNQATSSSQSYPSMAQGKIADVVGTTSYPNVEFLAPVVVAAIANTACTQTPKPAKASKISPKPAIQQDEPTISSPTKSGPSRSQDSPSVYNIKDCYLIATPRKAGGQPLVSPLMLDIREKDFDLAILVSSSESLQQPAPNEASLGNCKSCGFRFVTWESFMTHFFYSLCVTTVPRSDAEDSFIASQLTGKALSKNDATLAENLPKLSKGKAVQQVKKLKKGRQPKKGKGPETVRTPNKREEPKINRESVDMMESQQVEESQTDDEPIKNTDLKKSNEVPKDVKPIEVAEHKKSSEPKAQLLSTELVPKWTMIPPNRQLAALDALMSCRHSRALLTANKYPRKTNGADVVEDGAIPSFLETPAYDPKNMKISAVSLDCEGVRVGENGVSEVARISAIDYLSGDILIDTLVQPTQPVTDWCTKYSGITEEAMVEAIAQGKTLNGWPEARASLFEHIDANTVLVGQSLQHDLIALGIKHHQIVDTAILTAGAVGRKVKKRWGLKDVCNQLLGVIIQSHGEAGHDSVEDAFAAREVVLWCIQHPGELKQWGKKQRIEYYGKPWQKSKAAAGTAT
jgi:DNA polymerase III epsilon subunit-like protein